MGGHGRLLFPVVGRRRRSSASTQPLLASARADSSVDECFKSRGATTTPTHRRPMLRERPARGSQRSSPRQPWPRTSLCTPARMAAASARNTTYGSSTASSPLRSRTHLHHGSMARHALFHRCRARCLGAYRIGDRLSDRSAPAEFAAYSGLLGNCNSPDFAFLHGTTLSGEDVGSWNYRAGTDCTCVIDDVCVIDCTANIEPVIF